MTSKFNFTKSSIDALPIPPKGKRVYHYDTKTPALALCITGTGAKTFYLYRRVSGKPEQIRLGGYPEMSIEQARKQAQTVNGEIAKGMNPADMKREQRKEWTLGDLFEDYMTHHAMPHKRSWKTDRDRFKYLQPWAKRKLSSIRRSDVKTLHAKIGQDNGIYAANRLLALLKTMYNFGIHERDLPFENPAKGVKMFKEEKRERWLGADELPAFFQAVAEESNTDIRDYVLLSLLTGARQGNVVSMRWDELNLLRGVWAIPAAKTKTKDPLVIPLAPEAIEILTLRKATTNDAHVFPGEGRTGHMVEPKAGWARIKQRARLYQLMARVGAAKGWDAQALAEAQAAVEDVEKAIASYRAEAEALGLEQQELGFANLRLHDLRHTLASWQVSMGVSLAITGKSLGHNNVATTARYAHLAIDPIRDAVNMATSAIWAAGGVKPSGDVVKIRQRNKKSSTA
ncbi:site-specific integrase [Thermithiobacillus plumbiphilus]|uniref:Site-specific integrase n=1 Tax=Thermithiobacillus plumbiphilus TaxID=1729899 RepID=A0ABU9D719_9PROT